MTAYIDGLSVSQVAVQFGVNITTVQIHLQASDVELRPFRKLQPSQLVGVCRLHADGASLVELAAQCGVSASAIRRVLAEPGQT